MTDTGPTRHISWAELACHDAQRTPYPQNWRNDRAVTLGLTFEEIRRLLGNEPIRITSGYRTPAYNSTLEGAASNSQHVQGRAVDIQHPTLSARDVFMAVRAAQAAGALVMLGGLGLYATFVHVDVRPKLSGRLALWAGRGLELQT